MVSNSREEAGSRALQLGASEGKAPLTFNPAAGTATNLSADEFDARDASQFAAFRVFATVNANGALDSQASSSQAVSASRLEKGIFLFDFDRSVGRMDGCVHIVQPLDAPALTMTAEGHRYGGPTTRVQVQQRDAAGELVDGSVSLAVLCG